MVVPTGDLLAFVMVMIYLPSCLLRMVTGDGMVLEMMDLPSCLLRLVTGDWSSWNFSLTIRWHWGPASMLSSGVASSLVMNFFTSRSWSRCLPSDADVLPSDCTFFHFFYCAVCPITWSLRLSDYVIVLCCGLFAMFCRSFIPITPYYRLIMLLRYLHDCVLSCILLFVLQIDITFILRFHCATVLCYFSHWTLPVTVLRCYFSVSLLLLTVVLFYVMGQRVRVPLPVCLLVCITCRLL